MRRRDERRLGRLGERPKAPHLAKKELAAGGRLKEKSLDRATDQRKYCLGARVSCEQLARGGSCLACDLTTGEGQVESRRWEDSKQASLNDDFR